MRLPHEVALLFRAWLDTHFADRAGKVMATIQSIRGGKDNDPNFHTRMRGQGPWAELLRKRFHIAAKRYGLDGDRMRLRTDLFRPPAGPPDGRRAAARRVGPRHVHRPEAAAVCDGARSSNDYSSGRRKRLETAAEFLSPQCTSRPCEGTGRTAARVPMALNTPTPPDVTRHTVICMAHRLRTLKTSLGPKFTPNQATCLL